MMDLLLELRQRGKVVLRAPLERGEHLGGHQSILFIVRNLGDACVGFQECGRSLGDIGLQLSEAHGRGPQARAVNGSKGYQKGPEGPTPVERDFI